MLDIPDLEHKKAKTTNENSKKKKNPLPPLKDSVRSLWDNFKHTNISIIGVPEGEEKEQKSGNLFEKIMKKNFPNLVKGIDMQVQKARSLK